MMIKDQSISTFLDELASRSSTPGGGGVAAIMGALGAALASMVCNLTLGKKNHKADDVEMQEALKKANALSVQLSDMSQADADAFNGVMCAYGMAKDSDEEKAARSQAIQAALKEATDVPLACAKLAQVINIKLSKCGVVQAMDIAAIARSNGIGLMIGAMVETRLALGFGAHFAAGLGGFDWIDLDTALLLSDDPVLGGYIATGPHYQLDVGSYGHGGVLKPE